jgi:hypothetical protein
MFEFWEGIVCGGRGFEGTVCLHPFDPSELAAG